MSGNLNQPNSILARATLTHWEKVRVGTRWGRYVDEIERRAVLGGADAAGGRGNALDVGCDGGRWAHLMLENGAWHFTCTDINPEALEMARRRIPGARCVLVQPTDTALPCTSDSMDLLLSIQVPLIQDWFVAEASRVLRAGGALVTMIHNRSSWRGLVHAARRATLRAIRGTPRDTRWSWEWYQMGYKKWRQKLLIAGLRLIYEEGYCWAPFGRESDSPLVPLFVRGERLLALNRLTAVSPWVVVVAKKE
jgi:SAM-dependent methyltransferase